jgi:hypothetical protein
MAWLRSHFFSLVARAAAAIRFKSHLVFMENLGLGAVLGRSRGSLGIAPGASPDYQHEQKNKQVLFTA